MKNIFIIGSGLAGTSTIKSLADNENIDSNYKITICEKENIIGCGFPYSKLVNLPLHLLNMPIKEMSLENFPFRKWYQEYFLNHEHEYKEELEKIFRSAFKTKYYKEFKSDDLNNIEVEKLYDDIVINQIRHIRDEIFSNKQYLSIPRIIYGFYLQHIFQESVKALENKNITVNILPNTEVLDINEQTKKIKYKNKDKIEEKEYHKAILATGHWQKKDSINAFPANNILDKIENLLQNKKDIKIAVRGTGLSAIDAVKTIISKNHYFTKDKKGNPILNQLSDAINIKIELFSKHGLFPKIRKEKQILYENQYLTYSKIDKLIENQELTITNIVDLIFQDLKSLYDKYNIKFDYKLEDIINSKEDSISILKKDVFVNQESNEKINSSIWQEFYTGSSDLFVYIYQKLPRTEKAFFKQFLKTHHSLYLAPMPEVSALEIIELYEAGIININHTRVINENDFDFIVNATGQNSNIEECQNTLYKNLLSSGTIKSDTSITRKNSITSNMKVPNPTIEANINDEFKNNDGVKREFKSLQTYNKKNNKNKDLYSIGVASANFGSSRASRVIDNGKNIAKQITL